MSIIKSIKQQLGLGPAAENHFWDGSVPNQLSLKRGTPDAPGAEVMQVVDGVVSFPNNAYSPIALQAVVAASGLAVQFLNIPPTARRVTLIASSLSLSGTSVPNVQLGTASGLETSGYEGSITRTSTSSVQIGTLSTGFLFLGGGTTAATLESGVMVLTKLGNSTDTWICSSQVSNSSGDTNWATGTKTLAGPLTRLWVGSFNGTDTFDNGFINVSIEG